MKLRAALQKWIFLILLMLTEAILLTQGIAWVREASVLSDFTEDACETDAFRAMQVSPDAYEWIAETARISGEDAYALLASMLYDNDYSLHSLLKTADKKEDALQRLYLKQEKKPVQLEALATACQAVWADVKYFPVPQSTQNAAATVAFEDSWLQARSYGGERAHEGTDIMAGVNERGYYPVVSMTDGVVEKVGWLPQGGYRIGVRSPHGGYFYYAHLANYARDFKEGEAIQAGELLGMMGDTGYSEVEGTTGNFDVHLHVGIYIQTAHYDELSVNPYQVLKYLEKRKLSYAY